ncbi:hypothetical protein GCM10022243_31000 [Saccharothrix violaceirubra]
MRRPELTVGVKLAVARTTGMDWELIARRPPDRRSATRRQQDVRLVPPLEPAPRRLLPTADEGLDLRFGTLDDAGRAHWHFPVHSSAGTGDHHEGPSHDVVFRLPPAFDRITLVFAWPEIGFPETTITLPLPDRTAVDRATRSVWDAPVTATTPVPHLARRTAAHLRANAEEGIGIAPPQVLHRGEHAAIVLTHLAAVDRVLSFGLSGHAHGDTARTIARTAFGPPHGTDPSPTVAFVADGEAFQVQAYSGTSFGSGAVHTDRQDFFVPRPHDDVLDLLVAWPIVGLAEAHARITPAGP